MGPGRTASPRLTDHDRSLVRKCEAAVRDGLALEQWCRMAGGDRREFPLHVDGRFTLPNRARGYFGSLILNGAETSVMGCRQHIEFARPRPRVDAGALLREFVLGEFLNRAHWVNEDGTPGGFGVKRSLYQTADGSYGKFEDEDSTGAMHWLELGPLYRWVLLTITLNDFAFRMGPVSRRMDEAVCVTPIREFTHVAEDPAPDCALEVSIGYPFIEHAPVPNFFGFGPGKFGTAVKLFSFFLMRDQRIRVLMEFAAAPRARKVFDFWGVDPVYDGAEMLKAVTLGALDPASIHDSMDTSMLVSHCQVHQKLMDGAARKWEEWVTESRIASHPLGG